MASSEAQRATMRLGCKPLIPTLESIFPTKGGKAGKLDSVRPRNCAIIITAWLLSWVLDEQCLAARYPSCKVRGISPAPGSVALAVFTTKEGFATASNPRTSDVTGMKWFGSQATVVDTSMAVASVRMKSNSAQSSPADGRVGESASSWDPWRPNGSHACQENSSDGKDPRCCSPTGFGAGVFRFILQAIGNLWKSDAGSRWRVVEAKRRNETVCRKICNRRVRGDGLLGGQQAFSSWNRCTDSADSSKPQQQWPFQLAEEWNPS